MSKHAHDRIKRRFGVNDAPQWLAENLSRFKYEETVEPNGQPIEYWITDDRFIKLVYASANNSVVTIFPYELRNKLDEDAVNTVKPLLEKVNRKNVRETSQRISELYQLASEKALTLSNSYDPISISANREGLAELEAEVKRVYEKRQSFEESLTFMIREDI